VDAFTLGCPYPRFEAPAVALVDGRAAWDAAGCPAGREAVDVVVGRAVLTFAERLTLLTLFTLLTFADRFTLMFTLLYWGAYTFVLGA
jgi:hypothetical protein